MKVIPLSDDYYLSPVVDTDLKQIAVCCNDEEIFRNTLRVPFPYTEHDAQNFLNYCKECRMKYGTEMQFAVRNSDGLMLGCVGVVSKYPKGSHVEEIGYWIGSEFRKRGLATQAIKAFSEFMFDEMKYLRLEAITYHFNEASQKALAKAGFQYEGLLRKFLVKGDRAIDCKLFANVR